MNPITQPLASRLREDWYARAALAYFVYGAVYLGGAFLELDASRKQTFWGVVPWWSFYVAGALFMLGLPVLIWRRIRILCGALALLTAVKCVWLCTIEGRHFFSRDGGGNPYNLFFAVVAGLTAITLLLAALQPKPEVTR